MPTVLVATTEGLLTFDERGAPGPEHQRGRAVTTLARQGDGLWAIVEETEIWHGDGLDRWARVADIEGHRGTCLAAIDDDVFVGTSEARLFRVAEGALDPVVSFDGAEDRSA